MPTGENFAVLTGALEGNQSIDIVNKDLETVESYEVPTRIMALDPMQSSAGEYSLILGFNSEETEEEIYSKHPLTFFVYPFLLHDSKVTQLPTLYNVGNIFLCDDGKVYALDAPWIYEGRPDPDVPEDQRYNYLVSSGVDGIEKIQLPVDGFAVYAHGFIYDCKNRLLQVRGGSTEAAENIISELGLQPEQEDWSVKGDVEPLPVPSFYATIAIGDKTATVQEAWIGTDYDELPIDGADVGINGATQSFARNGNLLQATNRAYDFTTLAEVNCEDAGARRPPVSANMSPTNALAICYHREEFIDEGKPLYSLVDIPLELADVGVTAGEPRYVELEEFGKLVERLGPRRLFASTQYSIRGMAAIR